MSGKPPKDADTLCKLCFPLLPVYAHSGMKQPDCAMATCLGCWYTMFCWKPEGERTVTPPSFICKFCAAPLAVVGANEPWDDCMPIVLAYCLGCIYTMFLWKPTAAGAAPAVAIER
eukprot:COSAG01_NODE_751_length_13837_cov_78.727981_7_plen_116_part_00